MSISFYMRNEIGAKDKRIWRPYYIIEQSRPSSNSSQDAAMSYTLEGYVDEGIRSQYPRECAALDKALKQDKDKIEKLLKAHPHQKVEIAIGPLEAAIIVDTNVIIKAKKVEAIEEKKEPIRVIKSNS